MSKYNVYRLFPQGLGVRELLRLIPVGRWEEVCEPQLRHDCDYDPRTCFEIVSDTPTADPKVTMTYLVSCCFLYLFLNKFHLLPFFGTEEDWIFDELLRYFCFLVQDLPVSFRPSCVNILLEDTAVHSSQPTRKNWQMPRW